MKIVLTGKQARAALCNAATKDVRYYLNGLYFDIANSKLVSTTGHHMYISPIYCEDKIEGLDSFILERFQVQASIIKVEIDITAPGEPVKVSLTNKQGIVTIQMVNVIDGTFPNYERVIPSGVASVEECYFNASYMALIEKTYGKKASVKINFYGPDKSILVECKENDGQLVIMPMTKMNFEKAD